MILQNNNKNIIQNNNKDKNIFSGKRSIVDPIKINDLALWYYIKNSNLIKDGFGNISQINDLSGNNRHATQFTLSNQFLFVDNVIKNNAVARSSGVSKYYEFDGTFFENTNFTIFSVQKRTAGGQNIIFAGNQKNNIVRWEYSNNAQIRLTSKSKDDTGASNTDLIRSYDIINEFHITFATFSTTDGMKLYENGKLLEHDSAKTTPNFTNPNARLGKYAGNQSRWFTGDLGSLLCFTRDLKNYELNQVLIYLSILYNIKIWEL